jgi:polysaccharide export outer membrane protein
MHRSISFGLIGLLLACILAAQRQEAVPKDLMEYVRQARKAGLADSQIKLNAVRVGWPPEDLDAALELPAANPKTAETRKPAPKESPSASAAAIEPAQPRRMVNEPFGRGVAPAAVAKTAPDDEYFIGAGDVVQVSIWGEQSASVPSAVVRPDGKISMPLLKEVAISGLTPTQAGKTIAEQLDQYIKGANVTVVVSQINSKKIYLLGAVKKEGTIAYTYRMTVMQALSEAGGLTDYAKRKKIYVIRIGGKKENRLPFDYDAVVKGGRSETNITLEPGDTIVVPH